MKRSKARLEAIYSFDNLALAFRRARRGHRSQPAVVRFTANLDANLHRMSDQLRRDTLPVGRFSQFVVRDPKVRVITAPCLEERILHHAILNVCEPDFERWLIHDSYACRKGKGRIAALLRAREYAGGFGWYLKMDVRKYFDSVPHETLLRLLARRFRDDRLLALFGRIVRGFRGNLGVGLPIGALTSQHFANFYLGHFDRFAKETLRAKGYVRYMDDVAIWDEDKERLTTVLRQAEEYCSGELGLSLKPGYLNRTTHGMDFLGCRVFRHHLTLNRRSKVRYRRKLLALEQSYLADEIDEMELQQRGTALTSFTLTEGLSAWRYREATLATMPVSGRMARTG